MASRFSKFGAPKIIYDTDIGVDVDDLVDLMLLHQLAINGDCELIATIAATSDSWSSGCLYPINKSFQRPDIPVGARASGVAFGAASYYGTEIIQAAGGGIGTIQNALTLYRTLLAAADDNSITIICSGPMGNMSDLLNSGPDSISSLTGVQLTRKKVRELIIPAGVYPSSSSPHSHNFIVDPTSANNMCATATCPMVFVDDNVALVENATPTPNNGTYTGRLLSVLNPNETVLVGWRAWTAKSGAPYRPCWAQNAIMYACFGLGRGYDTFFTRTINGSVSVNAGTGQSTWTAGTIKEHSYLTMSPLCSRDLLSDHIEGILYGADASNSSRESEVRLYQKLITVRGGSISTSVLDMLDVYVRAMKTAGIWSNIRICWPIVGNNKTALLHLLKFPMGHTGMLPDPGVPLDLTQASGINSTTACIDSGINPQSPGGSAVADVCALASAHLSAYCRTNLANQGQPDIGAGGGANVVQMFFSFSGGFPNVYFDCFNNSTGRVDSGSAQATNAHYIGSRISATDSKIYRNGVQIGTLATTGGAIFNNSTFFFGGSAVLAPTFRTYGMFTVGLGLTADQCARMHTATQALQTSLARNN